MNNVQENNTIDLGIDNPTTETSLQNATDTPEMRFARVTEMSDKAPQKPELLLGIGNTFLKHFHSTKAESDLNNSVLAYKLAVQILPSTDTRLPGFLIDYGLPLFLRYSLTGAVSDIDQAISSLREAVLLTPEEHANLPHVLNNLAILLHMRFKRTGDLIDIGEAISLQRKCIQSTSQGHDHEVLVARIINLVGTLQTRFEHMGDAVDISEAISLQKKCIQLTSEGHTKLPARLNSLGGSLLKRFEHTEDLFDISEAISVQQKSIQLTPEDHEDLPDRLYNLGVLLKTRFVHTGDHADVSEAILLKRKSIQLTSDSHSSLPGRLDSLIILLRTRFEYKRDLADISEAISLTRKSIQLMSENHAGLPIQLNNLGGSLQQRFRHTGDLVDISEAISLHQKSIQLTSDGHTNMPAGLDNLGIALHSRFVHIGNLMDISEAILLQQKSIQMTPEDSANLPIRLDNLGNSLQARFEYTQNLADISEAILLQQKCIKLTPDSHQYLPLRLNNLGSSLQGRFQLTEDLNDISEAISLQQKSIQITPEGHADLPYLQNNLGSSLQARFKHTRNLADISDAISTKQHSALFTPKGHASLPIHMYSLGNAFRARLEHTADIADAQSAMLHFRLGALSISGSPLTRFLAAIRWAQFVPQMDQSQLLEAHRTAISLISQVAGLEQTIQTRHNYLINIASALSSTAAAAAIHFGQHFLALEWLEQGRCLVWSQLSDLRTPVDGLRSHDSSLADDVIRVSRALQNSGSRTESTTYLEDNIMTTRMSIQEEAHTHVKMAQEWGQLLIKVRNIPQFADFLRPASYSTLRKNLPNSGHVVVINIHKERSDALVLASGAEEPHHIPLPEFPYQKADSLRLELKALLVESKIRMRGDDHDVIRGSRRYMGGITQILGQLWTFVVKPILDGLGYSVPASKMLRIWWCVTGPLAFLPVHAAGIYAPAKATSGIHTTLSDFAVSSYIPTVRSLIEKKQSSREIRPENIGLLMVSQPDTPKLSRIPGTTLEVEKIKQLLKNHQVQHLCLESDNATVDENTTKPLQSGFYLFDRRLELSEIIKKHMKGAELAFLSACQTSTGDEKLSEEAVHLAGGMLAAGYRGVVATMWSIKDSYGPELAEAFYGSLMKHEVDDEAGSKGLSSDRAAQALHDATQQIRKTLGDSESSLLTWVPYVHFGI